MKEIPCYAGLDRYELGRELGVGAFGRVHAARDRTLERDVAIKFFTSSPGARHWTRSLEMGRIGHPNLLSVIAAGYHDGTRFIVMPLVSGGTVAERLASVGLNPREAVRVIGDVAAGLEALHSVGYLHCDIKPSNILLDEGVSPKAILVDPGHAPTPEWGTTPAFVGTPRYAPPEHSGRLPLGPKADVYALALVMAECLGVTGSLDFSLKVPVAVHAAGAWSGVGALAAFEPVVRQGLAVRPEDRPGPGALAAAARAVLSELPTHLACRRARAALSSATTTVEV